MLTKSLTDLVDMLSLYIVFSIGFADFLWVYSCDGWWRVLYIFMVVLGNSARNSERS